MLILDQPRRFILYETSQIRDTPWATYHHTDNTLALYQLEDWDMIQALFSIVRCASPTTVIIPALYDTIQYLERQKFDWSDCGVRDEILFKD
jgi:hypothetical protein